MLGTPIWPNMRVPGPRLKNPSAIPVYFPRINRSLEEFVGQMNNRPVSTEHNNSPVQLWTRGMLLNINSNHIALTEREIEQYGFDPQGLVDESDDDYQVHLDPPAFEVTETQLYPGCQRFYFSFVRSEQLKRRGEKYEALVTAV